jgi:hypothetical protein
MKISQLLFKNYLKIGKFSTRNRKIQYIRSANSLFSENPYLILFFYIVFLDMDIDLLPSGIDTM